MNDERGETVQEGDRSTYSRMDRVKGRWASTHEETRALANAQQCTYHFDHQNL